MGTFDTVLWPARRSLEPANVTNISKKCESVTSSVSCAKKYFEDKCTGLKQDEFFWYNAARYGRLEVMEWARLQGYSVAWKIGWFYIGPKTCAKAAEYGQLQALQWLKENDCPWDNHTCQAADTCQAAARNGHLSCHQWARENGCEWDKNTCSAAAGNGHISCLQWARENGCPIAGKYNMMVKY